MVVAHRLGHLPVHVAAIYGAPAEVVHLLLRKLPEGVDAESANPSAADRVPRARAAARARRAAPLAYARERRHFLSSTPLSVQPACDAYCQMEDLCDKARSGATTSDQCFSECVEDQGRRLATGS